ncbi:hypothetical protein CLF_108418, partial [Clonorchis sinensis]
GSQDAGVVFDPLTFRYFGTIKFLVGQTAIYVVKLYGTLPFSDRGIALFRTSISLNERKVVGQNTVIVRNLSKMAVILFAELSVSDASVPPPIEMTSSVSRCETERGGSNRRYAPLHNVTLMISRLMKKNFQPNYLEQRTYQKSSVFPELSKFSLVANLSSDSLGMRVSGRFRLAFNSSAPHCRCFTRVTAVGC